MPAQPTIQPPLTVALASALRETVARPLFNLSAACAMLDLPGRSIRGLIESGELRWAFNIAGKVARCVEVRVALESLIAYLAGDTSHLTPAGEVEGRFDSARRDEQELDAWLRRTLAPHLVKDSLRAVAVTRFLNCDPQHVHNLIADGLLKVTRQAIHAKASPMISAASLVAFLKSRRLP